MEPARGRHRSREGEEQAFEALCPLIPRLQHRRTGPFRAPASLNCYSRAIYPRLHRIEGSLCQMCTMT